MELMKAGRNDPCPCGSGKRYKKCCLAKDQAARAIGPKAFLPAASAVESPMSEAVFAMARWWVFSGC